MPLRPWKFLLPLTAALALAATACSGDTAEEPGGTAQGDLGEASQEDLSALLVEGEVPADPPEADLSGLPAQPDESTPVHERAAWHLLSDVSGIAGGVDPDAVAECPEDLSTVCTLTYGGVDLEFPVTSEEVAGGVEFSFEHPEMPVTREFLEDWLRHYSEAEAVFCDTDDVVVMVPGAEDPADFLCYAQDGGVAWVDSAEDTVSPYEAYMINGGSLAFYQKLQTSED